MVETRKGEGCADSPGEHGGRMVFMIHKFLLSSNVIFVDFLRKLA
jgi:hypothetical protein